MNQEFTVIMTTYNRPELAVQSLKSVQKQTYPNWKLIVVVDDTEADYKLIFDIAELDSRITVIKNEANLGKNKSVNKALVSLRNDNFSGYVVFLDDDDTLATDCLETFSSEITVTNSLWLVSQRALWSEKKSLTKNKTSSKHIHYLKDMLIFRRFSGETTHCINFAVTQKCQFPTLIKNAEEWIYFAQVATTISSFYYIEKVGTYTEGYLADGLSKKRGNFSERFTVYKQLWQEVQVMKPGSIYVYIYLLMRGISLLK